MNGRLVVLILFSASGSPLFFFFKFSHPASPSDVRFHEDSIVSGSPVPGTPTALLPASSPTLSVEISHPGWPLAEPKPEAKVLGVRAGRGESTSF